jgi:dethiobiotin synthetase
VDGIEIQVKDFTLPASPRLIVEGAGGLMVPLNDHELIADLAASLGIPVILVCNLYLGSINHSLLSIDFLKRRQIPVAGIIFNGEPNPSSEQIIEKYCPWPVLLRIPRLETVTTEQVDHFAGLLQNSLNII